MTISRQPIVINKRAIQAGIKDFVLQFTIWRFATFHFAMEPRNEVLKEIRIQKIVILGASAKCCDSIFLQSGHL